MSRGLTPYTLTELFNIGAGNVIGWTQIDSICARDPNGTLWDWTGWEFIPHGTPYTGGTYVPVSPNPTPPTGGNIPPDIVLIPSNPNIPVTQTGWPGVTGLLFGSDWMQQLMVIMLMNRGGSGDDTALMLMMMMQQQNAPASPDSPTTNNDWLNQFNNWLKGLFGYNGANVPLSQPPTGGYI